MSTEDDKTTPFIRDDKPGAKPAVASPMMSAAAPATSIVPAHMFNAFEAAKKRKAPKWAAPLLTSMAIFHVLLFLTMWAKSIWDLEMLEKPKSTADLAIAPPPPPPPPLPKGGVKPKDVQIQPKKIKVKDIVQPVKMEKQQVQPQEQTNTDPNGSEDGDPNGDANGVGGGAVGGLPGPPPPPPPPPPPAAPQNVPPTLLEGSRIAGNKNIVPDDVTKTEISRSGKDRIVGSFKLCITVDGNIASISQLKGTGFGAYDQKIQSEMRAWRYKPYMVNGKAVPVCTAVTFIYSQK